MLKTFVLLVLVVSIGGVGVTPIVKIASTALSIAEPLFDSLINSASPEEAVADDGILQCFVCNSDNDENCLDNPQVTRNAPEGGICFSFYSKCHVQFSPGSRKDGTHQYFEPTHSACDDLDIANLTITQEYWSQMAARGIANVCPTLDNKYKDVFQVRCCNSGDKCNNDTPYNQDQSPASRTSRASAVSSVTAGTWLNILILCLVSTRLIAAL